VFNLATREIVVPDIPESCSIQQRWWLFCIAH